MPTRCASSESEMSDETVIPPRSPSASAATTETPAGHFRKSARCSVPDAATLGEQLGERVAQAPLRAPADGVGDLAHVCDQHLALDVAHPLGHLADGDLA